MTNLSDVTNDQLQALKDFASSENKVLVDKLEEILEDVAKTGQYIYPWHFMKPLYACKLDQVTSEFLSFSPPLNVDGTEDEEEIVKLKEFRDRLLQMFDKFVCAPFTIQRVSEMLTNPRKHYKSTAKFFRGLEKNILVVSTIEPVPSDLRPILKRSHHDENPVERQNGYVETELKPQLKKIHLEEKTDGDEGKDISEENTVTDENGGLNEHETNDSTIVEESKETTTATTSTKTPEIIPSAPSEGLENMLVCNESVGYSNGATENEKTEEVDADTNIEELASDKSEEGEDITVEDTKPIDES